LICIFPVMGFASCFVKVGCYLGYSGNRYVDETFTA
jgi:hypothetical protein